MKIDNINSYFSYEILRRGYDYYKKGKIEQIVKLKDGYTAKVKGSEVYRVMIKITDDKYEMTCSCPYAEENNCKHMAAVLYSLKNGDIPIKKEITKIIHEELTDFEKFKRAYQKEYNRHFHARYYINSNERDEYIDIWKYFVKEGTKYINDNRELAYDIFEYFLLEINNIDFYHEYYIKTELIEDLFADYSSLLLDEELFGRFLAFIGIIYSNKIEDLYFHNKEQLLNFLYNTVTLKWQAERTIILFNKLIKDRKVYSYEKEELIAKKILIMDKFYDKNKVLKEAENYLNIEEVCDYLVNCYEYNQNKLIELLQKIIQNNKKYVSEKYYQKLLEIYKTIDNEKYLELLKKYFIDFGNINTYFEIKECYEIKDWNKIKKEYLYLIKNNKHLYRDICVKEEYYDELLESLEDEWIERIKEYQDILIKYKPKEYLNIYKNTLLIDIQRADSRKRYQYIMSNLKDMLSIPMGEVEVKNIITLIREKYKNKKALQEETDFFEETFIN